MGWRLQAENADARGCAAPFVASEVTAVAGTAAHSSFFRPSNHTPECVTQSGIIDPFDGQTRLQTPGVTLSRQARSEHGRM